MSPSSRSIGQGLQTFLGIPTAEEGFYLRVVDRTRDGAKQHPGLGTAPVTKSDPTQTVSKSDGAVGGGGGGGEAEEPEVLLNSSLFVELKGDH